MGAANPSARRSFSRFRYKLQQAESEGGQQHIPNCMLNSRVDNIPVNVTSLLYETIGTMFRILPGEKV